jgi:two-component system nitrate/nitrite response regulator NarL
MICVASSGIVEVVVAGDQPIMLEAVGKALRDDGAFRVVAECKDGAEALDNIRKHRPALALLDFSIPGLNAVKVLGAVNQNELPTKVIFFGTPPTDAQLYAAVHQGACGILPTDVSSSELILSLKSVARAEKLPLSTAVTLAVEREALRVKRAEFVDNVLTAREKEIMLLAAAALSNKEIGSKLSLSNGTVKLHLHNVYQKLGISNRLALVELANDYCQEMTGEP